MKIGSTSRKAMTAEATTPQTSPAVSALGLITDDVLVLRPKCLTCDPLACQLSIAGQQTDGNSPLTRPSKLRDLPYRVGTAVEVRFTKSTVEAKYRLCIVNYCLLTQNVIVPTRNTIRNLRDIGDSNQGPALINLHKRFQISAPPFSNATQLHCALNSSIPSFTAISTLKGRAAM